MTEKTKATSTKKPPLTGEQKEYLIIRFEDELLTPLSPTFNEASAILKDHNVAPYMTVPIEPNSGWFAVNITDDVAKDLKDKLPGWTIRPPQQYVLT